MVELAEEADEGTGLVFGRGGPEEHVFEGRLLEDVGLADAEVEMPQELELLGHLPQIQGQSQARQESRAPGAEGGRASIERGGIIGDIFQFAGDDSAVIHLGRNGSAQHDGHIHHLHVLEGHSDFQAVAQIPLVLLIHVEGRGLSLENFSK